MSDKNNNQSNIRKQFERVVEIGRRNLAPVSFVFIFACIGVFALLHSSAATGNDLVVTSVTMTPASPGVGQAATFSAVVKNQGTTATPAGTVVGVGFSIDGTRVTWNETNTASLAAGASITLTANAGTTGATWTVTSGPHTLTAKADDTNAIPDEVDESNNSNSTTFTIGNTGNLYVTPTTTSVLINNNFDLTVRLTPGTNVDGVQATLTYDPTKLQYVATDSTGSPFDVALGSSGGSGTVTIAQGNLSGGVAVDALIAKVTFKALAGSGSGTVTVAGNATKAGVYTNPTTANATVNFATPDTTPPVTTITAPVAAAGIFGTQTITLTATDAVGVTKVELYVNGVLKATNSAAPFTTFSVDTKTLANGATTLQTKAYDAAGNVGSSALVSVTVKNWAEDINQDGAVNIQDFSLLAAKFGQTGVTLGRADINGDAKVDLLDFSMLAAKFGQ